MSIQIRTVFAALLCTLVVCSAAFGQSANYTTGAIAGTVRDDLGAALPGVTVTATNLATGLTRTTYSGKDGEYDFTLLPPGKYRVVAELPGLGKANVESTTVLLGNTTRADLKLAPKVAETMTITAAAPIIDTQRAGMTQSVTSQQIDTLPLLGRDFRSLAILTPGVSAGSYDVNAITANGARPLSTDYNIDGASSNNDFFGQQTGGSRPPFTFSQAAIQEFQVIRTQYDAEYGRGVGAVVNAITKSGTNEFHGSAFYFDRRKSWAATRAVVFDTNIGGTSYPLRVSDSFLAKDVSQPGFVLGGPIIKDKVFFFVGYDSMTQSQPAVIGNDMRTYSQFLALTPAQQQTVLSKIQTAVGAPYEAGLNYSVDNDLKTYLVKFDGNLGPNNHWSVRDNITNYETTNSGSTSSFGLNQTNETDKFYQAVVELDSVLSDSVFNQFIGQVGRDQRPVTSQYSGTEFSINFGTTQYFGANDTTPNTADEKKYQLKDTVQFVLGNHSLKAGAELLHRNLFDAFPRYAGGYYSYSSLANYLNDKPNTFRQAYGPNNGDLEWNTNLWSAYVNDSFRVSPRLTLEAGLRYDYEAIPRPSANAFPQHPEFLTQIKDDKNNFAPRVGFAWDVRGDGRSVLRGGSGKFFEYMPDILLASPLQGISGALMTTTFTCTSTASNPCPNYPNILSPTDFLAASALSADLVTIGSDYRAQEAWRTSLQFEQRLGENYSVGVSAVYSKLDNIQGTKNINLVPTGYSLGNMPVYDYSSSSNPNRPYADMGIIRELTSDEKAWYRAQTLEVHKLATGDSKLSWDLSYTHADSIDYETNTRSTSTTFIIDPNNPRLSEGPSDNDVKHRVVGDVIYRLPWGFEVSAVAFWHSGFPYTAAISFTCSGCTANSLTGQPQTSQAANYTPVFVDGSGAIIDLTQANGMTLPQFSDFLAAQNARLIQRNSFRQPSVYDLDFRLSKTFRLTHGVKLEVLGEVFNALNRNMRVVTGANQDLFRVTYTKSTGKYTITKYTNTVNGKALNTFGLVQGYSGEVNPRQLQLAVKISF
ncbi:MAG: carboxypeptidase regulatory-like domain-containing protein [Thermoanaerobaculaceae bacterium]|nr:carboxypeptidase regulatory-like domain-containing protein [Thermoanaerobaculaceae bacterium]